MAQRTGVIIYVCMYVCVCVCLCVCLCMSLCVPVFASINMYLRIQVCIYLCMLRVFVSRSAYVSTLGGVYHHSGCINIFIFICYFYVCE